MFLIDSPVDLAECNRSVISLSLSLSVSLSLPPRLTLCAHVLLSANVVMHGRSKVEVLLLLLSLHCNNQQCGTCNPLPLILSLLPAICSSPAPLGCFWLIMQHASLSDVALGCCGTTERLSTFLGDAATGCQGVGFREEVSKKRECKAKVWQRDRVRENGKNKESERKQTRRVRRELGVWGKQTKQGKQVQP